MSIIHSIITTVYPSATPSQSLLIAVSLVTLVAIGLYVYRCFSKPYSQTDIANAVKMTRDTFIDEIASKNIKITQLESELAKRINEPTMFNGKYQRERVIAALAVELDGYKIIEEKADVIVAALE